MSDQNAKKNSLANRYELKRLLGWGAHGEVYQAFDIQTQETVAVKIFFSSREDIAHFLYKELNSISKLSHPNLLPFNDFGECEWKGERIHYIVTPYMEGGSLANLLQKKGTLSMEEALKIALQLVQALSYMHSKGHLHRDIKPANILLDSHGNAVLADFSISCSPDAPATGPVGTPEYSSPEQLTDANEQHPRIDVYCLGITIYEMLTNVNPFREIRKKQGQAAALQSKYYDEAVPPVSEYNASISLDFSQVIQKMITTSSEKRYQNMEEVRNALLPYTAEKDRMAETESVQIGDTPKSNFFSHIRWKEIWKKFADCLADFWEQMHSLRFFWLYLQKKLFLQKQYPQRIAEEVDKFFNQAQKLRSQSKWNEAVRLLHKILILSPEHTRAMNYKGDTLVKLKKYQAAMKLFNQAILLNPKYYSAYCHRGFIYSTLGQFQRAIDDYDVAIMLDAERPEAYLYRAQTHLSMALQTIQSRDFQKASEIYRNVKKDLHSARNSRKTSLSSFSGLGS